MNEITDFEKDSIKIHIDSECLELYKFKYFYDSSLLIDPEFCFKNKIEVFK
jgi:hypothetical protein